MVSSFAAAAGMKQNGKAKGQGISFSPRGMWNLRFEYMTLCDYVAVSQISLGASIKSLATHCFNLFQFQAPSSQLGGTSIAIRPHIASAKKKKRADHMCRLLAAHAKAVRVHTAMQSKSQRIMQTFVFVLPQHTVDRFKERHTLLSGCDMVSCAA